MTNVVKFPKEKKNTPPQSMEELLSSVEETRKEQIEYLMDEILSNSMRILYEEGFDLTSEHCVNSTALYVEAFKAAIYRSVGFEHGLHDVADQVMVIVEDESEESVDIISDSE